MKNRTLLVVVPLLLLSVGALSSFGVGAHDADFDGFDADNDTRTKEFVGFYGVQYTTTLNTSSDELTVELHNPTNSTQEDVPVVLHVYDRRYDVSRVTLKPGEQREESWELNETMDIGRTDHSVAIYGLGENASVRFNFTKKITADNPGRYPTPEIVDADLVTSTPNNRTGHFLAVTVQYTGNHSYATYVYVHTNQTDGERAPAGVAYGQSTDTAYLDLQEDPGDKVMGEVRLYRGSVQNDSGIRDQIHFEGRVDGTTEIRNESFEPITPPYEENSYRFTPDGADASDGGSLGEDVVVATTLAFGVVVVVSLVIGFLFRLR
jgi:hypothetical protein